MLWCIRVGIPCTTTPIDSTCMVATTSTAPHRTALHRTSTNRYLHELDDGVCEGREVERAHSVMFQRLGERDGGVRHGHAVLVPAQQALDALCCAIPAVVSEATTNTAPTQQYGDNNDDDSGHANTNK